MKKPGSFSTLVALAVVFCLIIMILLRELFSKEKASLPHSQSNSHNPVDLYSIYTPDSLYYIEYDTIVRVYETKTGILRNEFYAYLSTWPEYPFLRQIEVDNSGKYIAFLDNLNIAHIYNIFTGECEGVNDYYFDQRSHIFFSDDSKYFLMVDFREAEVDILSCPRLEYIAGRSMGYYRSNFWWENKDGKLVFYFEVVGSLYLTVFPDDGHGDSLVFSEPVNVGKISNEN